VASAPLPAVDWKSVAGAVDAERFRADDDGMRQRVLDFASSAAATRSNGRVSAGSGLDTGWIRWR